MCKAIFLHVELPPSLAEGANLEVSKLHVGYFQHELKGEFVTWVEQASFGSSVIQLLV